MTDTFIHGYLYLCATGGAISGVCLLGYLVWSWRWWRKP